MKDSATNSIWIGIAAIIVFTLGVNLIRYKTSEDWMGFFYPDASNLSIYTQSGKFESLDECQAWVQSQASLLEDPYQNYDHECGSNCEYSDRFEGYVCDETF